METPSKVATNYIAVWNETEQNNRLHQLERNWASDATYVDPRMAASGRDEIAAMIEGARAQFPGFSFSLKGNADGHGEFVRFSWGAGPDGEESLIEGTDMVRLDATGRIDTVVGFLDKVPAA